MQLNTFETSTGKTLVPIVEIAKADQRRHGSIMFFVHKLGLKINKYKTSNAGGRNATQNCLSKEDALRVLEYSKKAGRWTRKDRKNKTVEKPTDTVYRPATEKSSATTMEAKLERIAGQLRSLGVTEASYTNGNLAVRLEQTYTVTTTK